MTHRWNTKLLVLVAISTVSVTLIVVSWVVAWHSREPYIVFLTAVGTVGGLLVGQHVARRQFGQGTRRD